MAGRLTTEQKIKARKFYIQYGYTNVSELAKICKISRQALAKIRDDEAWDEQRKNTVISPQEIAQELMKIISEILKEISEKRAEGNKVAPSVQKDLVYYVKALRMLDEQYDIKGSLMIFARLFIEYVATVPSSDFHDKKRFVADLQKIFAGFLARVENG